MGKVKETFYKETQRGAHQEPHPLEEHLSEGIEEYRSLLAELEGKTPGINDPEIAGYLDSIDVLKDLLRDLEEKQVRYSAEIEGSEEA